jgi:hypothetical protein
MFVPKAEGIHIVYRPIPAVRERLSVILLNSVYSLEHLVFTLHLIQSSIVILYEVTD